MSTKYNSNQVYITAQAVTEEAKKIIAAIDPDQDYAFICPAVPGGDMENFKREHPELCRTYGKVKRSRSSKHMLVCSSGKRFN